MSETRYCSTCGTLLSAGAAICGECGARYQASPYERRATDAPIAWQQAPRARSRDLDAVEEQPREDTGIQLITRESLEPKDPSSTTVRTKEQYDQMMMHPTSASSAPPVQAGTAVPQGSSSTGTREAGPSGVLPPPLDDCVPGSFLKRALAAILDSVIGTIVMVPMVIGAILLATQDRPGLLAQILIGVGVALPLALGIVMIWLQGAKGFTIGKLIVGLRTARMDEGGPIGFLRSLGRGFVYGVFPLLMALSVFLDPLKALRGFHDRAVGSVVADIKQGRNPLKPRTDDFDRPSAEHYLGRSSVEVSAHENLLAEPGAAWAAQSAQQDAASAPHAAADDGWAPIPTAAASEAAPSAWSGEHSAPAQGGWQDQPQTSAAVQGGWQGQSQASAPDAGGWQGQSQASAAAQGGWQGQSQASAPEAGGWQSDAAWAAPQPANEPAQAWQPPIVEPGDSGASAEPAPAPPIPAGANPSAFDTGASSGSYDASGAAANAMPPQVDAPRPSAQEPWGVAANPVAGAGASSAASAANPAAAPEQPREITDDAWAGAEVDEHTRARFDEEDDLGDLEQTRISMAAPSRPRRSLRITADDGSERVAESAVVIGRNPSATTDAVQFVLKDDSRSVSKSHLRIDGTGAEIVVTDLGSTNGSAILRADGSRETLVPDTPSVLPEGARIAIGDRMLDVEREK